MAIKIGINGFGRIGRSILRQALTDSSVTFQIGVINDIASPESLAHLLKYDSVHGIFQKEVKALADGLLVGGQKIPVVSWKSPAESRWSDHAIDLVLECSGKFTDRPDCLAHVKNGAKKVIVSAPAKDPDLTVVLGVNDALYNPAQHQILSNASCTTNCLAPVVKVLHENFQVQSGLMTTVHSYTNDQKILDVPHKDLRRSRAAAVSQIPTTTGAAKAIGLVLPELKGKIDGLAIRVPTPNVSLVDFVCQVGRKTSVQEVNDALKKAAGNALKGILAFCEEPLVSIDFNGNIHSATVDAALTAVTGDNLVKVIAWYDNESGFSRRMVELTQKVAGSLV